MTQHIPREPQGFKLLTCEVCGGGGLLLISSPCDVCKGTGELIIEDEEEGEQLTACPHCDYGLIYIEMACETCGGTGVV